MFYAENGSHFKVYLGGGGGYSKRKVLFNVHSYFRAIVFNFGSEGEIYCFNFKHYARQMFVASFYALLGIAVCCVL